MRVGEGEGEGSQRGGKAVTERDATVVMSFFFVVVSRVNILALSSSRVTCRFFLLSLTASSGVMWRHLLHSDLRFPRAMLVYGAQFMMMIPFNCSYRNKNDNSGTRQPRSRDCSWSCSGVVVVGGGVFITYTISSRRSCSRRRRSVITYTISSRRSCSSRRSVYYIHDHVL
jgi:hypothetical protein